MSSREGYGFRAFYKLSRSPPDHDDTSAMNLESSQEEFARNYDRLITMVGPLREMADRINKMADGRG